MVALRRKEQNEAARIGQYGTMVQLGYSSAEIKDGADAKLREDLCAIFSATKPEIIYTHNLADKHPTHVAVVLAVIGALRLMPKAMRPRQVVGCEVWRDLDWMADTDKVVMDVTGHEKLTEELAACFRSQIAGGKRYDVAVAGRRAANATFSDPRSADLARQVIFGMDLTPLIDNDALNPADYAVALIGRFRSEVSEAIKAIQR
jgi:LmbE family N-acetylglucosaminyl deacetylase